MNTSNTLDNTQFLSLTSSKVLYGSAESLPLIKVDSPLCEAVIALQGAQLLEYKPKGALSWLWLSPKATFSKGSAIRGGIPICAPWFGVNQLDPQKPKHGFVRTQEWVLKNISEQSDGTVKLDFEFTSAESDLVIFPFSFQLALSITLSEQVTLSFNILNIGHSIMPFSWAFHSYFGVDNLEEVRVAGLDQQTYLDATDNFFSKRQEGDVQFKGEVDSVYENTNKQQAILGKPSINIEGEGCPTAIIWNPGIDLAHKMADISATHFNEFICVERGAAFENSVNIAPNSSESAVFILSKLTPST